MGRAAVVIRGVLLAVVLAASGFAAGAEEAIRAEIARQREAWNRGDIQSFMASYEKSSKSLFVGTTVVRGYDAILQRYLDRYPDRAQMGKVAFSGIEVRMLNPDWASVLGEWRLTRGPAGGGDIGGNFTLLFRKTSEGWRIVLDHTTQAPSAP